MSTKELTATLLTAAPLTSYTVAPVTKSIAPKCLPRLYHVRPLQTPKASPAYGNTTPPSATNAPAPAIPAQGLHHSMHLKKHPVLLIEDM